ncbi:hypothetical protein [Dactylosporangium sp. NPDC049140]|uniref:hypothetical protein n=1 Tax=Dactylosporangium sp. NPDC049140 TaxID=3155647 RepID=UPI00340612BF
MGTVNALGAVPLLVALALTGACNSRAAPPPVPSAAPSPAAPRLRPGTRVELTAAVIRVFGPHAFLVADADLPPAGQLVVSDAPVTVEVPDLVTLTGRVEQLDRAALQRYGAEDPTGVAIVAASVHGYPAESPTP